LAAATQLAVHEALDGKTPVTPEEKRASGAVSMAPATRHRPSSRASASAT
jgi:hypothetical protein